MVRDNSYYLTPEQLAEVHKKYGFPGEMAPGQPAKRKRRRIDTTLAAMDKKEGGVLLVEED